jgi:hypothetical protein
VAIEFNRKAGLRSAEDRSVPSEGASGNVTDGVGQIWGGQLKKEKIAEDGAIEGGHEGVLPM